MFSPVWRCSRAGSAISEVPMSKFTRSTQWATTPRYERLLAGAVQRSNERWMRDGDKLSLSAGYLLCRSNSLTTHLRTVLPDGSICAALLLRLAIISQNTGSWTAVNAWRLTVTHVVKFRWNSAKLTIWFFPLALTRSLIVGSVPVSTIFGTIGTWSFCLNLSCSLWRCWRIHVVDVET